MGARPKARAATAREAAPAKGRERPGPEKGIHDDIGLRERAAEGSRGAAGGKGGEDEPHLAGARGVLPRVTAIAGRIREREDRHRQAALGEEARGGEPVPSIVPGPAGHEHARGRRKGSDELLHENGRRVFHQKPRRNAAPGGRAIGGGHLAGIEDGDHDGRTAGARVAIARAVALG